MQKLKLRVWNPDAKKMTYIPNDKGSYFHLGSSPGFINKLSWWVSNGKEGVAYSDRSILMLYTGLRDKNGLKIYEADIIAIPGYHELFEVKFGIYDDGNDPENYGGGSGNGWYLVRNTGELFNNFREAAGQTIVGNSYENPELKKEDCKC